MWEHECAVLHFNNDFPGLGEGTVTHFKKVYYQEIQANGASQDITDY